MSTHSGLFCKITSHEVPEQANFVMVFLNLMMVVCTLDGGEIGSIRGERVCGVTVCYRISKTTLNANDNSVEGAYALAA